MIIGNNPLGLTDAGSSSTNAAELTAFGEKSVAANLANCGWSFAYNINPLLVRTTELNGGTVTHEENYARCTSGTDPNGVAFIRTIAALSYTPGEGALVRFTAVFDTPQADTQQLIGIGDNTDGWFFGYDGLQFGILRRAKGVDNWTYQPDWNIDTKDTFDPTKGNVFQIKFQWLGFGMQYFAMENDGGSIADVHRISYSNQNTLTSVDIPSLPITMGCANAGSTTGVSMYSPSAVGMSQGERFPDAFESIIGYTYPLTAVAVGDNYLFSLRNPSTYQGKDNKLYIDPSLLSLATDGSRAVTFRVIFNATLTGAVFTPINSDASPAEVDTSAIAFSGGLDVTDVVIARDNTIVLDLSATLGTKIWADDTVTLIATADQIGTDVSVGSTLRSRA